MVVPFPARDDRNDGETAEKKIDGRRLVVWWVVAPVVCWLLLACGSHCGWWFLLTGGDDERHDAAATTTAATFTPFLTKYSAFDNERVLNIHVVPHTHDDVGWRKTVEQYYTGANASIDNRGNVRSILSTTVSALLQHDARTFTYVETKFFSMWWNEQPDSVKDSLRYLIASKQWTFVNGGWCMHDEASSHYMGMMDQTTTGHTFLRRELGVVPTIGWQLDPFGHSATQASLMTATAGFDALYFGRIDYQDRMLRQLTRQCEGFWDTSSGNEGNCEPGKKIFWGLTGSYGGNYGPPEGFLFDALVNDEPLLGATQTRLMERLNDFLQQMRIQSDQTIDNHIMVTFGTDFTYQEAHQNFANMDVLIGSIMEFQHYGQLDIVPLFGPRYDRIEIFYSNPEYYTKQKHRSFQKQQQHRRQASMAAEHTKKDESLQASTTPLSIASVSATTWQTKTDDFFPYADHEHCYWTGYFTSRTSFKRMERVASSFLLAARQIDALAVLGIGSSRKQSFTRPCVPNVGCVCDHPLFALEDALGVAQHHDAISGTGKQHVANDYSLRLHNGLDTAAKHLAFRFKELLGTYSKNETIDWNYCPLLHNESFCQVSQDATASNETSVYTLVYNSLPRDFSTIVRLPVASAAEYEVRDLGNESPSSSSPVVIRSIAASRAGKGDEPAEYVLLWETGPIPPLGAKTFAVTKMAETIMEASDHTGTDDEPDVEMQRILFEKDGTVRISNELVTIYVDSSTGQLQRVASNGIELVVEQTFGYYTSFDSNFDHSDSLQNSGAYIFRPSTPTQDILVLSPKMGGVSFVNTTVGTEVHVTFVQPWIRQVTRILAGQPFVELEYTVGPIPTDDGRGKEIIARYTTPIKSSATFFTDSNGREFQRRRRNYRPSWDLDVLEPVAGNFYPVNAAIYLEDASASLAVVVDRSQSGASLQDGALELMVQRRTLADDARGVEEPLNETCGINPYPPYGNAERIGEGVVVRGIHRLMVGAGPVGASLSRAVMDAAFAEPLVFVGTAPIQAPVTFGKTTFSGLQAALPENVFIATFMELSGRNETTALLRLGHQYGLNENDKFSAPVSVDITSLFVGRGVASVTEMTLTGNQELDQYHKRRLVWADDDSKAKVPIVIDGAVTLYPMEIRTFEIVFQ